MTNHLYIHVPFCLQKCGYCAFYSVAGVDGGVMDRYVDAVLGEMDVRGVDGGGCRTVYFGGGTPSLLGAERVARMLARIGAPEGAEVTLEANPETVSEELLVGLREAGVGRLSLGVQSLVDEELRYLCRVHDGGRGLLAVEMANRVFERVSVDLIYGLPGQKVDGWLEQLERVAGLGTEHLSAYELTYEPGTPLGSTVGEDPDRTEFFFATHERLLELGLDGYEVSNFARSRGARSRHNLATWAYRPYVGLGPGAHSFSGAGEEAARRWNEPDLGSYLRQAETGVVPHKSESLSPSQQLLERLILGLRTTAGISIGKAVGDSPCGEGLDRGLSIGETSGDSPCGEGLERRFSIGETVLNPSILERLEKCVEEGLVVWREDRIVPTLEGMGLADGLAARLVG